MEKTLDRWNLAAPVGTGQPNQYRNVLIVQQLLNRSRNDDPHGVPLIEDGLFGPKTRIRMEQFQRETVHLARPDGVAQVGGATSRRLARLAPHTSSPSATSFAPSSSLAALAAKHASSSSSAPETEVIMLSSLVVALLN